MKLLVVLLTVGLSVSEKLDRAYLPPPGAKSAEGSLEDLQTPLEYRDGDLTETPILRSENNGESRFVETEAQSFEFADGKSRNVDTDFGIKTTHNNEVLPITPENPDSYTRVTGNPENVYKAMTPEMEYNMAETHKLSLGVKYPIKENGMDNVHTGGYHFGNPENMPFIAMSEGIMPIYHPNAFGMYGGNPMIIKTYSELPQVKPNMTYKNHIKNHESSDDLYTSDVSYGTDTLNPDHAVTFSTSDLSNLPKIHKPTTGINSNRRSQVRKTYHQRPERLQAESDKNAVILNYKNSLTADSYSYSFDTSNGIHKDESARTVDGIKALGSYSYTGDDGKTYSVVYSADENGFQPRGDHLPTAPPIPEAIQKVIEQANKDKISGTFHDGFYDEEKYGHMKYQGPVNRYLQKMQGTYKLKNRNRVVKPEINNRKPELINDGIAKKYQIEEKNTQQYNNAHKRPVNNINGQFGLRKISPFEQAVISVGNQYNSDFKQKLLARPSNAKHGHQRKIAITNKEVSSRNHNQSAKPRINYKMSTPQDAGYYYVPPKNIFIEEVFQNKPTTVLKEVSYKFDKTDEDVETKSVPSEFYYINQRDYFNKPLEKLSPKDKSYFTNTEKSNPNKQIYGNNVYESSTQDVSQSINDFGIASTTPLSETVTGSIQKLYEDTLSTSDYDQENTKTNDYQEETVFTEQEDSNDISPTTYYEQNENKFSTTPMPSQSKYTSSIDNSNKYETSNVETRFVTENSAARYLEKEGYLITTPKPDTFENFLSSTYTSTFTVDGGQTEPTPNIKVDGFGRPIQDSSQQFNANEPNYEYFTPGEPLQDEKTKEIPQFTSTYFSYEEKFADKTTFPKYDELVTKASDDRGPEQKATDAATADVDNDSATDIIGEDFSGPKQPQGYDPQTGYYY